MSKLTGKTSSKPSLLASYADLYGDVVLRHRARLAEKALRIEAERSDREKSQFIANMSHELRTPLNAIIGFSQIMRECETLNLTPDKIVEYSGYINDTSEHLLNIINDLLDMSKIQSGKQDLSIDEVNAAEILRGCLTLVSVAAKEGGVRLVNEVPVDFQSFEADALRLKQVFTNIISNAIKWTPQGGTVTTSAFIIENKFVQFNISDTGKGMSPQEIETAKMPFCQVESDLDRSTNGTGLGIPIASGLVEMHKGTFEILSKPGVGTTVKIMMPITQDISLQEVCGAA
ncbi:MAG: sensor histidine kinase [Methyloligellaceae bacterium]